MQTTHYGFKLFESAEKPTWLVDWNETMNKIDSTIARLSGGGGDTPDLYELTQRVQALEGRVDSDELRLNVVEGDIVDILATLDSVQTALAQAQADISNNHTYVEAQISSIEDNLTDIRTSIGSLSVTIGGLSTRVGDCETDITDLDTRVSALENSSAGNLELLVSTSGASTIVMANYNIDPSQYKVFLVFCLNSRANPLPFWLVPTLSIYPHNSGQLLMSQDGNGSTCNLRINYGAAPIGSPVYSLSALVGDALTNSYWKIYGIK